MQKHATRARGTRMHAIITIRPKTGAENEVLGIGAHEPLGLKLRKAARGHMHWGPNVWMQCYFGSGEAVSHSINSTPWHFFIVAKIHYIVRAGFRL